MEIPSHTLSETKHTYTCTPEIKKPFCSTFHPPESRRKLLGEKKNKLSTVGAAPAHRIQLNPLKNYYPWRSGGRRKWCQWPRQRQKQPPLVSPPSSANGKNRNNRNLIRSGGGTPQPESEAIKCLCVCVAAVVVCHRRSVAFTVTSLSNSFIYYGPRPRRYDRPRRGVTLRLCELIS